MSEPAISRFPIPALETLPEDLRERILAVEEKAGFIPNVFLALAWRPAEFRAFFAYHDALMERDSGLTKGEREMIVVVTSALNQCLYCVVAHGAVLRIREKNPRIADELATNWRKADITPRQRAMLDYAVKVSREAETVSDADHEALRAHGSTGRTSPRWHRCPRCRPGRSRGRAAPRGPRRSRSPLPGKPSPRSRASHAAAG